MKRPDLVLKAIEEYRPPPRTPQAVHNFQTPKADKTAQFIFEETPESYKPKTDYDFLLESGVFNECKVEKIETKTTLNNLETNIGEEGKPNKIALNIDL